MHPQRLCAGEGVAVCRIWSAIVGLTLENPLLTPRVVFAAVADGAAGGCSDVPPEWAGHLALAGFAL